MAAHVPPTPPANRTPKGPGEPASSPTDPNHGVHKAKAPDNLKEQGEQGNMRQNTTNAGHQDR